MSDQDIGDAGFEDRIRELLGDGDPRPVSARDVIAGARRRRARHRATAAGSSLAVLGVLGAAVGAVALTGGPGRTGASPAPQAAAPPTASQSTASGPAQSPASPPPATCSASVPASTAQPTTTQSTTDKDDGLRWDAVSGTTAGIPWSTEVHVFPDSASASKWENRVPGTVPPQAQNALHPGTDAVFRTPGEPGWTLLGAPDYKSGTKGPWQRSFLEASGRGIGQGVPVAETTSPTPGAPAIPRMPGWTPMDYPAYTVANWIDPAVDHLCVQYATRAEYVPVLTVQASKFVFFGVVAADKPKSVFAYDAQGREVGEEIVDMNFPPGSLSLRP